VRVAGNRDESGLTLRTAVAAFGDSIPHMFLTTNTTVEAGQLIEQ
jgi:hypothetical protein